MPLLDGLQFCFRMNETSGNRVDSVGGLQLAPTNITAGAGRFGNAVDLAGSSSWLQATGYNSVYRGVGSFTVAAWVNLDNLPPGGNGAYVVNRWFGGDPARDYILRVSSTGNVGFDIVDSAGTVRVAATNNSPITTGNWHLLVGWYDLSQGANGTIYVQVNNGTIFSFAMPAAKIATDTTSLLSIGSINIGLPSFGSTDGRIDQVCKWSRVLTADERAELWNSGVGKAFPFVVDLGGEIGWWCPSLDGAGNGTANLVDLSESGNRGTLTNMDPLTDWVSDSANGGTRALDFDGVNDFIPIGSSGSMVQSGAFSVSAWCRRSGGTGTQYICADYNASGTVCSFLLLARTGTGRFEFGWENPQNTYNGAISTTTITNNVWYHVAATWDGTTRRIYVNGIQEGTNSTAQSQPSAGSVGTMAIGRPGSFNGLYWTGQIDDCRLFNRALTQTEITALASQRGYQRPAVNGIGGEALWICPSLDTFGNGTLLARDLTNQRTHGILTNMDVGDWVSNTANGGVRAIDLDGDNDFITCGYSPRFDLASVRTVTAWIFARAYDGAFQANDIVNTDNITGVRAWQMNAFDLNNNDTDAILNVFSFGTGGGYRDIRSSTEILATNRWHFIAFTTPDRLATVSEIKLYVDGVQVGTTDASSGTFGVANTLATGNTLNIGRRPGTSGHDLHFNGLIDDVRLFHRVLSASEIAALYVRGYQLPSNTRRRRYAGAYGL